MVGGAMGKRTGEQPAELDAFDRWARTDPHRTGCRTCRHSTPEQLTLIARFVVAKHEGSRQGIQSFIDTFLKPTGYTIGEHGLDNHMRKCVDLEEARRIVEEIRKGKH